VSAQGVHSHIDRGAAACPIHRARRHRVAMAIASSNRTASDVAREFGVSWPTAHKAAGCRGVRGWPNPSRLPGLESMRPIPTGSLDLGRSGPIHG
jgi:hypothetical protein